MEPVSNKNAMAKRIKRNNENRFFLFQFCVSESWEFWLKIQVENA